MYSSGVAFPTNSITVGHIHVDVSGGGVYKYLGGNPLLLTTNWLLISGELTADPDTSAWDTTQQGARWFNKPESQWKGWNGYGIVFLG